MARRSSAAMASMSECCTLTATAPAVGERRAVDLGERGARDGRALERREERVGLGPEFGDDAGADGLERAGRHLVLKPFELGAEGLGQERREHARELPGLDEQAAQAQDRAAHAAPVARVERGRRRAAHARPEDGARAR